MEHTQAARILEIMAQMEPGYEDFAAKYGPMLADVEVPDDFADMTLELLRDDPERAAQIAQYERNLSRMQSFGLGEVNTTLLLIASILLILRPEIKFHTGWNWKFLRGEVKIKTNPANEDTLNMVLKKLGSVFQKLGEGISDVGKTMSGEKKDDDAGK